MAAGVVLSLSLFQGILAFLLVFVLVYAALLKTRILGDNNFISSFISLAVAMLFFFSTTSREYLIRVTPAVVVLLSAIFFILLIMGFTGNLDIVRKPGVMWSIMAILLLIFFFAGINIFTSIFHQVLSFGTSPETTGLKSTLLHPATLGLILLFLVAAVVTWIINK